MHTEEFKIRTYGRTELARLYDPYITPEGAWKKLREWIAHHPTLPERLQQLGYDANKQRIFTPAQVQAIVEVIGEP